MAKAITAANFEQEVLKAEKPVLLDFWATWCGPCMRQGPIVEELAEEGYCVGKIDVDQEPELAQKFRERRHILDAHLKERRPEVYELITTLRRKREAGDSSGDRDIQ